MLISAKNQQIFADYIWDCIIIKSVKIEEALIKKTCVCQFPRYDQKNLDFYKPLLNVNFTYQKTNGPQLDVFYVLEKVFKNESSKICGRQPLN